MFLSKCLSFHRRCVKRVFTFTDHDDPEGLAGDGKKNNPQKEVQASVPGEITDIWYNGIHLLYNVVFIRTTK